jgi:3-methyl-2-oxobutanoate hydroxymethyltransferase
MKKVTVKTIKEMKNKEKISALTCYSYFNAKIFNEVGIDILLVGDSMGNVVLGYENTIPVTMEDIIYHTRAVSRGNTQSLLVADMPFMSYQASDNDAIKNAGRLLKEGYAEAVKLEGGEEIKTRIQSIVSMGIPVIGHLGLQPQSVNSLGGYFVQGKTQAEEKKILKDAEILEKCGAFAIVLECIPAKLAKTITENISIPTIGIGAGKFCDGQILVFEDMVGLSIGVKKKFVKQYADIGKILKDSAEKYKVEVKNGKFPSEDNILG